MTSPSFTQLRNLTGALHALYRRGYARPLIIFTRPDFQMYSMAQVVDLPLLTAVSGYNILHVGDSDMSGKGRGFEAKKRVFDDPSSPPTALLAFDQHGKGNFTVGTDAGAADCLLIVGTVGDAAATQYVGRIMRPYAPSSSSASRGKVVKVIRIAAVRQRR